MLSKAADALPGGDGWQFEPKWDGFRTLVFRDGDEIVLQSRDEKPMNRYFPELLAPLAERLPERCVVDGEIVIAGAGGLDFEALLLRIHPAASRVKLLAAGSPASAGTRTAWARWSARSCSASTTGRARCTTSASPRRSPTPCASSSSATWRLFEETRSTIIPGVTGPKPRRKRTRKGNACPARPAVGTAART